MSACLPRVSLWLTAVVYSGLGTAFLLRPDLVHLAGVEVISQAGMVEIRAFYGGLQLGVGGFFVLAALRQDWHHSGLYLQILSLGGMALVRGFSLFSTAGVEGLHATLLSAEALGCAIGIGALRSLPSDDN